MPHAVQIVKPLEGNLRFAIQCCINKIALAELGSTDERIISEHRIQKTVRNQKKHMETFSECLVI